MAHRPLGCRLPLGAALAVAVLAAGVAWGTFAASDSDPYGCVMLLFMQHSGSLRFYAGRVTLRYDLPAPEWLDRALEHVRERGYQPFIVLDDWEEPVFRERFGRSSTVGKLDWKPSADVAGPVRVRIYDPDDRTGGESRLPP